MGRADHSGGSAIVAEEEKERRAYYEPAWKIDPSMIGKCHLEEFFSEEIWMLQGLAALLEDLAANVDEAGQYPKEVRLSLKSLAGLEKSINRAAWSLKEKIDSLHTHMLHLGAVTYTGR